MRPTGRDLGKRKSEDPHTQRASPPLASKATTIKPSVLKPAARLKDIQRPTPGVASVQQCHEFIVFSKLLKPPLQITKSLVEGVLPKEPETNEHQQRQRKNAKNNSLIVLALTTLDADFKASSAFSSSCPHPSATSTTPRRFPGAPRPLLPPPPDKPFRVEDVLAASLRLRPLLPLPPPPPPRLALLLELAPLLPLPLFQCSFFCCTQAWKRVVHRNRPTIEWARKTGRSWGEMRL